MKMPLHEGLTNERGVFAFIIRVENIILGLDCVHKRNVKSIRPTEWQQHPAERFIDPVISGGTSFHSQFWDNEMSLRDRKF